MPRLSAWTLSSSGPPKVVQPLVAEENDAVCRRSVSNARPASPARRPVSAAPLQEPRPEPEPPAPLPPIRVCQRKLLAAGYEHHLYFVAQLLHVLPLDHFGATTS